MRKLPLPQAGSRNEPLLEGDERGLALSEVRLLSDFGELGAERVEEERVDHLVDVLLRGVVHAVLAARLGVEGGLEDGAEDRGGDLAPVEALARVAEEDLRRLLRERRDRDVLAEQGAADVGEGPELVREERAALLRLQPQRPEELRELQVERAEVELAHEVEELVLGEDAGVLGVDAEDEADAELVQGREGVGRAGGVFDRYNENNFL